MAEASSPSAAPSTAQQAQQAYLTLLQLEKEARHADTDAALAYLMVNRARVLVSHRQAVLFRVVGNKEDTKTADVDVVAISDVPTPDPHAPFVRWLKRVGGLIAADEQHANLHEIETRNLPEHDRREIANWVPAHLIWCPLKAPDGHVIGALLMASDTPWGDAEALLMDNLADAWGHAWAARLGPKVRKRRLLSGWPVRVALALILAVQFLPVSQTALAPAEVVARAPELVAAPMDGVIETVHVAPNSAVDSGDILFSYDDTVLAGRLDIAEEELLVAQTALRTARQGAFNDPERKAEVALLQSRVALREAERDHIRTQVARKDVRAGRDGVAVFRDAAELEGRPVKTGERVMLLAGPHETELRVELPVGDAIALEAGAPVRLFLDRSPLEPVDATLEHIGYEAEMTAAGVLSYRLIAQFTDAPPRIGLRGTAKVEGQTVALFLYLFRRPLSALRQWIGI